eukprot:TRINITY_DN2402_c0_g1_i4.p1 TRINITY_DN2402_c0_g1~~TRINITY_DN2402_c0_g1_i4.p1  ORF type:complete len:247 (-),score=54.95 TRINITY_DN2402_c0_g1_i4:41-781(-)
MPGGANVTGTLGHVAAALELAHQIENGETPEPDNIFLPLGSSCTSSGLVVGIALARKLGVGFKKPLSSFHLHSVIIHHKFAAMPSAVRFAMSKLIGDTAKLIKKRGGPDVVREAQEVLKQVQFHTKFAVEYGLLTEEGKRAREVFKQGELFNKSGHEKEVQHPWMCACFTSKSGAALLEFLEEEAKSKKDSVSMLWCTKSVVQAAGEVNPLERAMKETKEDPKLKQWLKESTIEKESDYERHMVHV